MIKDMWQSRWDCIIHQALFGKISICKRIFFNKIACMVLLVTFPCSLGAGHQEGLLFFKAMRDFHMYMIYNNDTPH